MKLPLTLIVLASVTAGARAQLNLYLESTQDVASLCDVNNPNFFVGNNPTAIALTGDRLFVGGLNNSAATASLKVVKIENIFGARAFRTLNMNTDPLGAPIFDTSVPPGRGFYGMTYAPGAGLIVNYDGGSVGIAGGYRVFDVDTQLNPILVTAAPAGVGARGGAGAAWDFGFGGVGFDYNNDAAADGPLVSILDFAGYPGSVQAKGPFGIIPRDTFAGAGDGLAMFAGRRYDGNSLDGGGNAAAPVLNTIDINGNRIQGTLWRDIAIHPTTGDVAARASNDLVLGTRNASNGLSSLQVIDLSPGTNDPYSFQIMQRCEYVTGVATECVVYNDYSAAATTIAGWTKGADSAGGAVTVAMFNSDGTPFTGTSPAGVLDYSWDAVNHRLAVADFAGRRVYIFGVNPPAPACAWAADGCYADYNNDGGIDGDDVISFFADWDANNSCADADASLGVDGDDVIAFFDSWDAGGTGFPGC